MQVKVEGKMANDKALKLLLQPDNENNVDGDIEHWKKGYRELRIVQRFKQSTSSIVRPTGRVNLIGGILDRDGNSLELEIPPGSGNWVHNNIFNENNVDIVGNIERWEKACTEVLQKDIQLALQFIIDSNTDYAGAFAKEIKDKKEAINAAHKERRIRELTNEKRQLINSRENLTGWITAFTRYETLYDNIRWETQEFERAIDMIIYEVGNTVNASRQEILDGLTTGKMPIGLTVCGVDIQQKLTERDDYETQRETEIENLIANVSVPAAEQRIDYTAYINLLTTHINERYDYLIAQVNSQLEPFNDLQAELEHYQRALRTAQAVLIGNSPSDTEQDAQNNQAAKDTLETIRRMWDAREQVSGWTIAARERDQRVDLSESALRTQPFNTLLQRVNQARERNNSFGWPESENDKPDNHQQLLLAIVEAKATARFAPASAVFTEAINPAAYALQEHQLLTLSAEEILEQMQRVHTIPPFGAVLSAALPSLEDIRNMKTEVLNRLRVRQQVLYGTLRDVSENEARIQEVIDRLNKEGVPTPQLDAIERALSRFGIIDESIRNMFDQDLASFLDAREARTKKDWFTTEEQRHPIAYVKMMDMIFGHRQDYNVEFNGRVGTEAAFLRNQTLLNMDQLRDELVAAFNIPGTPTFEQAVENIGWRLRVLPPPVPPPVAGGIGPPMPTPIQDISAISLTGFLCQRIIYRYLKPRVKSST